jgi:hypothetical protein
MPESAGASSKNMMKLKRVSYGDCDLSGDAVRSSPSWGAGDVQHRPEAEAGG